MGSALEKTYFSLPIFMQNMMVSSYGRILAYRRFGSKSRTYVQKLMSSQWMSQEELCELQNRLLLKFVRHAFAEVPFYQDWASKNYISANDIRCIADINKLPIIEKEEIRNDPTRFCSQKHLKKRDVFTLFTSGTSGKPLTIFCDKDSRRRHYTFWTRLRKWMGIGYREKRATFCGRIIVAPEQKSPPFWRFDLFGRNILFSSYHMSENNLIYYYKKLKEYCPKEILGYPSSLFALAKFIEKEGLEFPWPICVFTTAETLLSHQRDTIEKAFGCKIIDQYGCTEMALFVSQCEYGKYHVHPEHGYLEIIGKDGYPVGPGETGEAVCTGFVNMTMPLLRYRLGDRVCMSSDVCQCGRSFPIVAEIVGRMDDILVTPNGRPLGRLDPVFKGLAGIYETQIVQRDRTSIDIYVVVDSRFTNKSKDKLIREIQKRTGREMEINLHTVKQISRDTNGKFRSVVSTISERTNQGLS